MARTFTGLKLQGQLGKFGRIAISDISAYVELPDGKVLSGTEWGNMLLWDGGFIKVEISKKGKKLCHNGIIEAIYLDEGELISAGADGYVKLWDFESIDSADISDENATFELEPMLEIKVGSDVSIKSLARSIDPDTPTLWYCQDAYGAIWLIDIVASHTRKPPKKLISFHSGEITGLQCSPVTHQAASIAQNGSVRVYDLQSKEVLSHQDFPSGGSSLVWAPVTVDKEATTIITGHTDGVVRVLKLDDKPGKASSQQLKSHVGKYYLHLVHVCKPHNQAVTCMDIDPKGQLLASGGKDSVIFFLDINDAFSPIGFIKAPSPITTVRWSNEKEGEELHLLVCCEDGTMLEVDAPRKEEHDTSKTYFLDPLKFTIQKFATIKDRLRAEEEEARQAAERERKQKEKEERKRKRKELLGDDYVSSDEEEEAEEEEEGKGAEGEEQKEEVQKPKGPSSILTAFYDSKEEDRKFWVSMSGYDAGYLYRCSMEEAGSEPEPYEPPHTIPVPNMTSDEEKDVPVQSMIFSTSGEYFLTGTQDGFVCIFPLPDLLEISDLSSFWALPMHDNHYGAVSHLCTSHDDKFVVSGGADGNVFIYEANLPSTKEKRDAVKKLRSTQALQTLKESEQVVNDIDNPNHYSIEDAKQKAEHDRKVKLAEEKKQHVRRLIASLRRTFVKLQDENRKLPEHLQLGAEEFVMDPDMECMHKEDTDSKEDLLHKEMSWDREKHNMAYSKIKTKFKGQLECERFTVWSFSGQHHVSSFRTASPSKAFQEAMDQLLGSDDTYHLGWTTTATGLRDALHEVRTRKSVTGMDGPILEEEGTDREELSLGAGQSLSKDVLRRIRRQKRLKELKEHEEKKPSEKSDDPADIAAYEEAKRNMGDYKLKTAVDFVVSEGVTTQRKRKELLLLRQRIKTLVGKIEVLQNKLHRSYHKPVPAIPIIRPEETPEKQMEYTREMLVEFREQEGAREEAERQAAAGVGEGGFFGGFGGGGDGGGGGESKDDEGGKTGGPEKGVVDVDDVDSGDVLAVPTSSQLTTTIMDEVSQENARSTRTVKKDAVALRPSYVEFLQSMPPTKRLLYQEQQIRYSHERDSYLSQVDNMIKEFDKILLRLVHEKVYLDIIVVTADLRHITQFEEMTLLKEFEKRETTFTSRYRSKKQERQSMDVKIEETKWEIADSEKQVARLQEQEKALMASFTDAVGDNKFKDFLLKVYKKKIKRAKKQERKGMRDEEGEEDSDEEEEEEEESDDDLSSSDEDSDEDGALDDSVCPPGCDQSLYDRIVDLREKRLDLEESLGEEKKTLEMQRKEMDSMNKKAKSMESQVKTALQDLQAFQLKKQQRLNELDQVVVLGLHQVLHFVGEGEPPTSTAPCLVFSATALNHLGIRIGELGHEKQQEKKVYRELKQNYQKLVREKREMLANLTELRDSVNRSMMLKFGQIVDMDKLEVLQSNPVLDEKRVKLDLLEKESLRETKAMNRKVELKRRELMTVTQENTERNTQKHKLVTNLRQLQLDLDSRQKTMSKDSMATDSQWSEEEREKLQEISRMQVEDIENIRAEIEKLMSKSGHVQPPSQPPVHPSNLATIY